MFGFGAKKDNTKMLNPKLGSGASVIFVVSILIFYLGIQGGLIGGAISGTIAYVFYRIAIKQLAAYKKIDLNDLTVDKPKEVLEKEAKSSKSSAKFWKIFLTICGIFLLLCLLLFRLAGV